MRAAKLEIAIKVSDKGKGSKNTKLVPLNDALTKPREGYRVSIWTTIFVIAAQEAGHCKES